MCAILRVCGWKDVNLLNPIGLLMLHGTMRYVKDCSAICQSLQLLVGIHFRSLG